VIGPVIVNASSAVDQAYAGGAKSGLDQSQGFTWQYGTWNPTKLDAPPAERVTGVPAVMSNTQVEPAAQVTPEGPVIVPEPGPLTTKPSLYVVGATVAGALNAALTVIDPVTVNE